MNLDLKLSSGVVSRGKVVWMFRKFMLFLFLFVASVLVSGCSEEEADLSEKEVNERLDKLVSLLEESDRLVDESMSELADGEYDKARYGALNARKLMNDAREIFDEIEPYLSQDDAYFLSTFIEYNTRWALISYKTANIMELYDALQDQILDEDPEVALPKVELLERGYRENAGDWEELAVFLQKNMKFMKRAGFGEKEVEVIFGLAETTYDFADILRDYRDTLESKVGDYQPVAEREIRSETAEQKSELIPEEVADFFDTFDMDGNGRLSIGEAQEFFFWVENNIEYRYDDENAENPIVGYRIGDGREGGDYRQTPLETLTERAGDCEDMATLEAAFYKYYGIETYIVGLDAKNPGLVDHAAAIVKISDDKEAFEKFLGGLLYYEIGTEVRDVYGNPVTPGVYMIVDNTYSGALGYISGGTEPGTFTIHCIIPFEKGYGDEWNRIVDRCVVDMD